MSLSAEPIVPPASAGPAARRAPEVQANTIYDRAFWYTYVANTAFTLATALMYRYADFVLHLGGTEWNVGLIVGVGMIGSLSMRFFQGFGIDHFGPRRIWLWSNIGFIIALAAHLLIYDARGPAIFLLRIGYATSVAGVFGASITSISRKLPLAHAAEAIGMLGTSGFIGMAFGPVLGDVFCGHESITRSDLNAMFLVASLLGLFSLGCAALATRHEPRPKRRRRPPMLRLLLRYHPGSVMLMSMVLGVGLVIPTTFLPTYIEQYGLEHTGMFFLAYSGTAFLARVATRNFPHTVGVRPMIYLGLASLIVSLLLYLPVQTQWGLLIPGVFAGIAHAVLFPSVTAQGSTAFPDRYRGLGTTLMLAMLDFGMFIGNPLVGRMVEFNKRAGWPPYSTTFVALAIGVVISGVIYALTSKKTNHG
jgi:MFS family permease